MATATCSDRDGIIALLDEYEAVQDKLAAVQLDALNTADMLTVLARRENLARKAPVLQHRLINRLAAEATAEELGAKLPRALAMRLRISPADAKRRVEEAADLGPRIALTGEPLEPLMPNVARGQAEGAIGAEHIAKIRKFFTQLPVSVDFETKLSAERELARHAANLDPEAFRKVADRLQAIIDQDGTYTDADRRRRRGVTLGRQGADGMSPISGQLTPEARAVLEAIFAKLSAPGMCNLDDETPCVEGAPSDAQVKGDLRTPAQRNHDALLASGRITLSTGDLGQLNGLPVTVVVSTTLKDLESAAGQAVTAGGSLLPMADVLRMASHAHHYLAIFDGKGIPLHLGRSRRTASPGQRIVLYSRDRGCTAPGCTAPAYQCQVHHAARDWIDGGNTNIEELTLACGSDNRKVKPGGFQTRIRADGRCEWIPPPHLDDGSPRVNDYHHPENLMAPDSEADPDG
ncbi:hypothetical protein MCHIJ_07840 [Mycolicibacterium chitae]|uniref:Conserved protein of uncharacterized function possible rep13e12 repeat protein n=2 Tax=Mycolicibacterium TaxID=1866885 RepID=A0A448ICV3_MYCCI|nr:HNH endonuclease signature motif containing protein [Mycolicibacterium chitae]MCV7104368.1 HNH endonuclease [Mycolicibacterium chitae]BBZ01347.1 hypothetical protein MCHIJ_07840 [Mycolicibacterium chitae]VEG50184.1 Conserved protein of uncharacterised function possible rep13e12 repeat protein [Mycolicibacterium chitae]